MDSFFEKTKIKTGADFNIVGTAGTGGDFVIGSLHRKNTYDINGNASVKGTGGSGQDVRDSFGVGIDRDTWLVNGTSRFMELEAQALKRKMLMEQQCASAK